MKKTTLLLSFLCFGMAPNFLTAQDLTGKWHGMLDVQMKLRINLENGTGKGTILEMLVSVIGGNDIIPEKCRKKPYSEISLEVISSEGILYTGHPNRIKMVTLIPGGYASHGAVFGPASKVAFAYSGYRRLDQVQINLIKEIDQNPLEKALDFRHSIDASNILPTNIGRR